MVGTSLPSLLSGSNWPRALSGRMPAPVPIVCMRIALTGMVVAEVKVGCCPAVIAIVADLSVPSAIVSTVLAIAHKDVPPGVRIA